MIVAKYLVIGAGLAGASIAWRLAQSGAEIAILEQDLPGSVQGNAHGSARSFRYTGHDGRHAGLVKRARAGWAELEAVSGNLILHRNGALDFGAAADVRGLAQALAAESIAHEVLSAAAAGTRWPAIRFDGDVLWHPDAAVVDAEVGVWSMVGAAQGLGAQLVTEFEVAGLEATASGYCVTAKDGRVAEGAEVIVAIGRHLPQLPLWGAIPKRLRIEAVEIRQGSAFYFPYRQRPAWGESLWPSTVHKAVGRETHSVPGRREAGYGGVQIWQVSGKAAGAAARQDVPVTHRTHDLMVDHVARQFPGLEAEPFVETPTVSVDTPDGAVLIEREAGLTIVASPSGDGASFAPLIGELVTELVRGKQSDRSSKPRPQLSRGEF